VFAGQRAVDTASISRILTASSLISSFESRSIFVTSYEHLLVETGSDGVCTITLNRPERLNAVNVRMSLELPQAINEAAMDDAVRVIVITGSGRAFCSGLDLADPDAVKTTTRSERLDPMRWVGRWVLSITQCDKPVVAAVNGAAAGAGFGLALACDLRVLHSSATFTAGYVRRGLSPDAGVSWFLPRIVGHARAMDLLMTGRDLTAAEAVEMGLATTLLEGPSYAAGLIQYASRLAAGPPIALALTKRLMLDSSSATLESHLRHELTHIKTCFASNDVKEAIAAFGEKRAPNFVGE
jgi:2-(1,2-epoxy-1,2-dihydrophenyl)acetyl-CoA isomerase